MRTPPAAPLPVHERTGLLRTLPVERLLAAAVGAAQQKVMDALAGDLTGGMLPAFMSASDTAPERVRAAYEPDTYAWLLKLKRRHDSRNLFRVNHNLR